MLAMVGAQKQARTPYLVGKAVLAAALVLDPEAAATRHEKAKNDRGVSVDQFQAGVGVFSAHSSPGQVAALMASIDAHLGPAKPEENRTLAQRRFDVLSDLVCGPAVAGQWQAMVVVSFETLPAPARPREKSPDRA